MLPLPTILSIVFWNSSDKVCQWFYPGTHPGTLVSHINKNDNHDVTEILLKVALNTITLNP
jgi:hypothetical protein